MNDILIQMGITTLLTFLKNLKGEANKRKWKKAVKKVYDGIKAVYGDDEDFQ